MNKITHKQKPLDYLDLVVGIFVTWYIRTPKVLFTCLFIVLYLFSFSSLVESLIQYVGIIVRYTRIGVYLYLFSLFLFFFFLFPCAGQHFGRAN